MGVIRWRVGDCGRLAHLDDKVDYRLLVKAHVVERARVAEALALEYEHLVVEQNPGLCLYVPLQVGDEHASAASELHEAVVLLIPLRLCAAIAIAVGIAIGTTARLGGGVGLRLLLMLFLLLLNLG